MLFLVDGYNVTKADPATRELSLADQRDALVARLRTRGRDLLGEGSIVVVFDGDASQRAADRDTYPVAVEFSRGQSADDAIVHVARRHPSEAVCLVTSDRGLVGRVRDHVGARIEVRTRGVLFESARRRGKRSRAGGDISDGSGTPTGGDRITAELKKIWLPQDGE